MPDRNFNIDDVSAFVWKFKISTSGEEKRRLLAGSRPEKMAMVSLDSKLKFETNGSIIIRCHKDIQNNFDIRA